MSSSKALMKVLTTPAKIASALDWKKAGASVLSLDIHKDRIGLAVASHPSYGDQAATLEPIRLVNKGKVDEESRERIAQLVKEHKVCGFVVSFPLQKDTGRMGAPCGRVLHTLDNLLSDTFSAKSIVTPSRPLCLWDPVHPSVEKDDEWGRSSAYTQTSDKQIHVASVEQYNQDENIVAEQVWEDFCRANWPDLYTEKKRKTASSPAPSEEVATFSNSLENEHWDDSASYVKVALL